MSNVPRPILVTATTLAAVLWLTLAAQPSRSDAVPPWRGPGTQQPRLQVAVAGDSTTAQDHSWRAQLRGKYVFSGYAHSGFTSGQVLTYIRPARAHVLVVKVGINDFRKGGTVRGVLRNVALIVRKVGATSVLISAICPTDVTDHGTSHANLQALGAKLNYHLERLAADRGWEFVDPDAAFRTPANGYSAGYSDDGVHPTTSTYKLEAAVLSEKIEAIVPALHPDRR